MAAGIVDMQRVLKRRSAVVASLQLGQMFSQRDGRALKQRQAKISWATLPATSVKRKSRPL